MMNRRIIKKAPKGIVSQSGICPKIEPETPGEFDIIPPCPEKYDF